MASKRLTVSPAASTPAKRKGERAVARALKATFKKTMQTCVPRMADKYRAIMEEHRKGLNDEVAYVLAELGLDSWVELVDAFSGALGSTQQDAATRALAQLKVTDESLFNQVNDLAVQAAKDRAASLVGMKWLNGELIPNPSAEWAITESTREGIRQLVQTALTDGLTVDEFKKKLEDSYQFSDTRAEMIARTELASAHVDGTVAAWKESGLVEGKRWLLGSEHEDTFNCDCSDNEADGVIGLDEAFSSGDEAPPAHPNCVCVLVSDLKPKSED